MVAADLIFDLGMHHGDDAAFYLAKGFRVVALEANAAFCAQAASRFASEIASQRLVIVPRALWHESDVVIPFFLNPVKDDWSSALPDWAGKGGHELQRVEVPTVTLTDRFARHGVPHYLKIDVEGLDEACLEQLLHSGARPDFVSVEVGSADLAALLRACGYDRMQVVNQAFHHMVQPPEPAREGRYAPARFHGHMSGLFSRELDPTAWVDFTTAVSRCIRFDTMRLEQPDLAVGWIDLHATRAETLSATD